MNTPLWSIKREMIIKDNEVTDQSFGYSPNTRPILQHLKYGIVNLDKPSGPTSHETVSWVKKILNISKTTTKVVCETAASKKNNLLH